MIPLAKYLIDHSKEDLFDPETMDKVQRLKSWNPVMDDPGLGDTDEEEDTEEDTNQGVALKANDETRRQESAEEDSKRNKSQGKGRNSNHH